MIEILEKNILENLNDCFINPIILISVIESFEFYNNLE